MKNLIKNKRGFSLVELMVVVAIMGTLAAIAIPAYNEYRKSAKKTAYKSDLLSLHRGWLAFGVELDSFCERETTPNHVSLTNVGMASLASSKLYGARGLCEDPGTIVPTCTCSGQVTSTTCSGHMTVGPPPVNCNCAWDATAGRGPGKHNLIGFSAAGATCLDPRSNSIVDTDDVLIRGEEGGAQTVLDIDCELNITTYRMGVAGHISGDQYYGASVNHNGVLVDQDGDTAAIFKQGGVCS